MSRYWRNKSILAQHNRRRVTRKFYMSRMQLARVLGIKLKDI